MTQDSLPAQMQKRIEAERAGIPFLVVHVSANDRRVIVLDGPDARVGRLPGQEVVLSWDTRVSRLHAVLGRIGTTWTISDVRLSRHGTYVNEKRIDGQRRLEDGDVLRFGATRVVFHSPEPVALDPTDFADDATSNVDLTGTQRRVLVALCRPSRDHPDEAIAATDDEIALELVVSRHAVKSQMRTLYKKLEIPEQNRKRVALVRAALNSGLVSRREL